MSAYVLTPLAKADIPGRIETRAVSGASMFLFVFLQQRIQ